MKIGIVGYGSIGKRHARNFQQLGHQVLIYDPALKVTDVRNQVGFEREIYDQADAVVVCSPSWMHPGALRASIERGKPVLVEKPIGTSTPETIADLLAHAVRKSVPVMMGNMLRFHPIVDHYKKTDAREYRWGSFIVEGPVSATNRQDGVLLNSGSHEVDLAMYMLGPVTRVLAAHVEGDRVGDTVADFILEHESGCRSAFHLEWRDEMVRFVNVAGDNRSHHSFSMLLGEETWNEVYLHEAKSFIDMIEGKPDPRRATGDDGLATLRVLLDVKKKALQ